MTCCYHTLAAPLAIIVLCCLAVQSDTICAQSMCTTSAWQHQPICAILQCPPLSKFGNLPAANWHSDHDCSNFLMHMSGCALQVKEDDEAELARQQSTRVA